MNKNSIEVRTTPVSPALIEAYKFQRSCWKGIFLMLVVIVSLLTFVSAVALYGGESTTLELEKPYAYYSVVGNFTPVDLNITQDGNFVTITPNKYSETDSFEIIFFDIENEVVVVYSGGGGGSGGGTKTVYRNINTTEYVYDEIEVQGEEKIVEVPGEDIETTKIPLWANILIGILLIGLVSFVIAYIKKDTSDYIDEKEVNEYE